MSTRGALAFLCDDELKVTYNHFDSYPDGLGADVLDWICNNLDCMSIVAQQVRVLRAVDDSAKPTAEEWEDFKQCANCRVSSGDDWYALLRETQGNPDEILKSGVYIDASNFPLDSLFCEWVYVINLDTQALEVYQGFRTSNNSVGLWSGQKTSRDYTHGDYYPVSRVLTISFAELSLTSYSSKDIMNALNEVINDAYEEEEDCPEFSGIDPLMERFREVVENSDA